LSYIWCHLMTCTGKYWPRAIKIWSFSSTWNIFWSNSSICNIFWSYSSTCNIFWSCYCFFFGPIPVPVIFFGLVIAPLIFFGPIPLLFLVLLLSSFLVLGQSSVFGLIMAPRQNPFFTDFHVSLGFFIFYICNFSPQINKNPAKKLRL
jgi:hypothetical protein